jgi:hypothetical protein
MKIVRTHALSILAVGACAATLLLLLLSAAPHQAQAQNRGDSRVQRGFAISPVPMNLQGKNPDLVGLGSYYVNAVSDCNACHTWQTWAPGGNPYLGQPKQINVARFLAGGRNNFPIPGIVSRDITPYADGLPAGLTLPEFIQSIRTGHDSDDGELLQIMPWPWFQDMTDTDLAAIYEYLRSIPPIQPGPGAG